MTPSISREKLIAHLKETIIPAKDTDNDYRFVYVIGRNMLAENILAKIICGGVGGAIFNRLPLMAMKLTNPQMMKQTRLVIASKHRGVVCYNIRVRVGHGAPRLSLHPTK